MPKTIWETKLRDDLGLRKKLKKKDWPIIYGHVLARREQGKETAIYLNGTRLPWGKAWKEIRRSGATRTQYAPQGP
ncbi:hypothetical protein VPNG_07331 [Cytospora leucostoma]|uniref:Uncharacterized protein n=1 Tax=Cytospora leucostoma TaxID=1230097 RepID=A0A423WUE8_9PEZI|nr:hypothetical protein VPNG_07331 [Cytospora leucostoma]